MGWPEYYSDAEEKEVFLKEVFVIETRKNGVEEAVPIVGSGIYLQMNDNVKLIEFRS